MTSKFSAGVSGFTLIEFMATVATVATLGQSSGAPRGLAAVAHRIQQP